MDDIILIDEPLGHSHEFISGPHESDKYLHPKYSKLLLYSDVSLDITIRWTIQKDDMSRGVAHKSRCPAGMYRSENINIMMPYFYLVITRPEGTGSIPNKVLHVEIYTPKKNKEPEIVKSKSRSLSFAEPQDIKEMDEEDNRRDSMTSVVIADSTIDTVKRSKSPFNPRSWTSREKKRVVSTSGLPPTPRSATGVDYRIPEFIPKNSILVGGENGRFSLLPKPSHGSMNLVSDEYGGFEWQFIYPPKL